MPWAQRLSIATQLGLVAWFLYSDLRILADTVMPFDAFGGDGLLYSRAAAAWLDGADPWDVTVNGLVYLAAPPPTLIPFVLTAWMPETLVRSIWVLIGFAAVVMTVRRLRLPIWCVLFPPSIFAVLHGSIEPVMVLCLVSRWRSLAPLMKLYAIIPMAINGQWRALVWSAAVLVVSAPFLPWAQFAAHAPEIVPRLVEQTGGGYSAIGDWPLTAAVIVSLCLIDRRVAAFAIVPALWPNSAPQYAAMLLPVAHRLPVVALFLAVPTTRGAAAAGIVVTALIRAGVTIADKPARRALH